MPPAVSELKEHRLCLERPQPGEYKMTLSLLAVKKSTRTASADFRHESTGQYYRGHMVFTGSCGWSHCTYKNVYRQLNLNLSHRATWGRILRSIFKHVNFESFFFLFDTILIFHSIMTLFIVRLSLNVIFTCH